MFSYIATIIYSDGDIPMSFSPASPLHKFYKGCIVYNTELLGESYSKYSSVTVDKVLFIWIIILLLCRSQVTPEIGMNKFTKHKVCIYTYTSFAAHCMKV